MKAMVLAAGKGTRLLPLTLERAKPAMPLAGRPIVARLVERLAAAGVDSFRMNLHHRPESVRSVFDPENRSGPSISFSYEPEILGTAGGLKANESFFDSGTFLMCNGKIIMDFPLREALEFHRERKALATLILYRQTEPFRWTPLRLDAEGRIYGLKGPEPQGKPGPEAYVFTGLHIIEPEVFDFIPHAVFYEINGQVYPAAMEAGRRVLGFAAQGLWSEPSTPQRYLEAQREFFLSSSQTDLSFADESAMVEDRADMGEFVSIGKGCMVESEAVIENSILWDRVRVKRGSVVRNCVIGSDVTLAGEFVNRVVTVHGEAPVD